MPKNSPPDEQKTERFNMFMSQAEMQAIDDWAWENKIRSKSEAVRRLCQIGLIAEDPVLKSYYGASDVMERSRILLNFLSALQDRASATDAQNDAVAISSAAGQALDLFERIELLRMVLGSAGAQISAIMLNDALEDGIAKAGDWREVASKQLKNHKRRHDYRSKK